MAKSFRPELYAAVSLFLYLKEETKMLLKNSKNIEGLLEAISKCNGDVILRSVDGMWTFPS